MAMDISKLHLLFDNETVRRMIVAWPDITLPRGDHRREAVRSSLAHISQELLEAWSRGSGVSPTDIIVWERMLFANGIITPEGEIDPLALSYLRRVAIARLPKDLRPPGTELPPKPRPGVGREHWGPLPERVKPTEEPSEQAGSGEKS